MDFNGNEVVDAKRCQPEEIVIPQILVAAVDRLESNYNMSHPNRGKCIVFNHYRFSHESMQTTREGTSKDIEAIQTTFTNIGFEVIVHEDATHNELMDILKDESGKDHSENDCLIIIVLTHGSERNILHAFDRTYCSNDLWKHFVLDECPTLATKPKLFFLQACRGKDCHKGTIVYKPDSEQLERDNLSPSSKLECPYQIPNEADFLIVYSTTESYLSFRHPTAGSCFIQALCNVFRTNYREKDVLSMLTIVNREVAVSIPGERRVQMPQVCHTLTRDLLL